MMNSLLANMRLLGLDSDLAGQDWYDLSRQIEKEIEKGGWDLAEESVYIFSSDSEVLVALSVIGPVKPIPGPWKLFDWTAAPVVRQELKSDTWDGVMSEAMAHLETLQKTWPKLKQGFILRAGRRLTPSLRLGVEAIFHE